MQKSYADTVEQSKRQLAARGALQSGELGYSLGQIDYQRSADLYDLNQQLMDAAQRFVNEYGGTLSGLSAEQIDAIRQAAMDIYGAGYRFDGAGGGAGGSGGLQYTGGAKEALAAAGYSDEEVLAAIQGYAGPRGWEPYEAGTYGVQQNGQRFNADGSPWNGSGTPYIAVKVMTPGGRSTELIPLGPPSGAPAPPQPIVPPPAPAPPPPPPVAPNVRPIGTTSSGEQIFRTAGGLRAV